MAETPNYRVWFYPVSRHSVDVAADTPEQALARARPIAVAACEKDDDLTGLFGNEVRVDAIDKDGLFVAEVADLLYDPVVEVTATLDPAVLLSREAASENTDP